VIRVEKVMLWVIHKPVSIAGKISQ
jgi:hypothetical protein